MSSPLHFATITTQVFIHITIKVKGEKATAIQTLIVYARNYKIFLEYLCLSSYHINVCYRPRNFGYGAGKKDVD